MQPLTLEDVIPLDEFAGRRREYFEAHRRYLDRYRRVRVGPRVTLEFANRQTLWFHLQDVLRVARLSAPAQVQPYLDVYNRLLPRRGCLQAALLIGVADETHLTEELAAWQTLQGEQLRLRCGSAGYPATLITCRPEDRCIGAAHWVEFTLAAAGRQRLADFSRPARIEVDKPAYRHASLPLSDEVRQSLLDDLHLSERNA
jgi:hypothetical protein